MASNFQCTSRFSQTPVGVDRVQHMPWARALLNAIASIAALPSTLVTSKPASSELNRVESGAGGDIEDLHLAARLQLSMKKRPSLSARALPVDQLVPLLDEGLDVLVVVVVGFPHCCWIVPKILRLGARR